MGAQAALEVASAGIDDVTLVDIVPGLAEGEAMDISQKIAETGVDVEVRGSSDFSSLRGSKVVVITAGLARKPGMTRMDLLEKNAGIVAAVAKVTHIAPADAHGKIIGSPVVAPGVIHYPVEQLGLCAGVTNARYKTTTEVYPDSPRATPDHCNDAQVAAVRAALDFALAH